MLEESRVSVAYGAATSLVINLQEFTKRLRVVIRTYCSSLSDRSASPPASPSSEERSSDIKSDGIAFLSRQQRMFDLNQRNICTYFSNNMTDPVDNTTANTVAPPPPPTTANTILTPASDRETPSTVVYELLRLPKVNAAPATKAGTAEMDRRPTTTKRPSFHTLESAFSKLRSVRASETDIAQD